MTKEEFTVHRRQRKAIVPETLQPLPNSCSRFKILWKLIILLYIVAMIPVGLIASGDNLPLYFTFWGWIVLGVYFFLSLLGCFWPVLHFILPFLQSLSFSMANLITLSVWGAFAIAPHTLPHSTIWILYNVSLHGLNLLFMYFDIFLFPHRFRPWYVLGILLFAGIYAMVSGIYFSQTGYYEYPPIDWKNINTLYWLLGAGVALALVFLSGYGITTLGLKYWGSKF